MVGLIPVTNEDAVVGGGFGEWDGDPWPAKDLDGAEATGSLLEVEGWEVEEASNLVFEMHDICEVATGCDWAVGAVDTILP